MPVKRSNRYHPAKTGISNFFVTPFTQISRFSSKLLILGVFLSYCCK